MTKRGLIKEPESKRAIMECNHPSSQEQGLAVCWQSDGLESETKLLADFLEMGETINAAIYGTTLERLRAAIRRCSPELLTKGTLLLYYNVPLPTPMWPTGIGNSCNIFGRLS